MKTETTDEKQLATIIAASMHEIMAEVNWEATKNLEKTIAESAEKVAAKFTKKSGKTLKKEALAAKKTKGPKNTAEAKTKP